jgi:glycosyltransferase involved in cell wall biosynthesis
MKLIVQIPCFNEEETIKETIQGIPRKLEGIDRVEILIINDGSTDNTYQAAMQAGVDHVVEIKENRGLAHAFKTGLNKSIELGADIVVNTDGDNQYLGDDIRKLVHPIIISRADIVIGSRPIRNHPEFSPFKKLLQLFGSWVLRKASLTEIPDAASGFRAFSRDACHRLIIHSKFSHCMETLIQAGNSGMSVHWTDIRVNSKTRESRLFKSVPQYLIKSGSTILFMSALYAPGRFFSFLAITTLIPAAVLGIRFLYLHLCGLREPGSYLPSLILLTVFSLLSIFCFSLAVIGELLKSHRKLNEEILYQLKKDADSNFAKTEQV